MTIKIAKSTFSEITLRKALYWFSEYATWSLYDDETFFLIEFNSLDNTVEEIIIEKKFHQLLNDYYLREQINIVNKGLREKIIQQALAKVYLHNG